MYIERRISDQLFDFIHGQSFFIYFTGINIGLYVGAREQKSYGNHFILCFEFRILQISTHIKNGIFSLFPYFDFVRNVDVKRTSLLLTNKFRFNTPM